MPSAAQERSSQSGRSSRNVEEDARPSQAPTDGGGGAVVEYKLLEEEDVTYEK
ncbi:hypothetical protein LR48_Vigan661s002700 [Vigna angularis]|uniref:Uncharacterized protein n=1 Tax=Phaseolus angularis TaxID=3914 RepID=A0A0L9TFJ5_PHAAN|nr:hypothetical protein LR48_Vigan661s002700 [Vigna angularis]